MSDVPANVLQEDFTLLLPEQLLQQTREDAAEGLTQTQYILLAAAVTAMLLLAWAWVRWRHRASARRIAEAAHLTALKELAEWRQLTDETRYREAVAAISGTLRRYVERRYGIPASTSTTEEFWEIQNSNPRIPKVYDPFWQRFTSVGDLIKYAGRHPDTEQFKQLFGSSVQFVESSHA
jgi:hypothetical protein